MGHGALTCEDSIAFAGIWVIQSAWCCTVYNPQQATEVLLQHRGHAEEAHQRIYLLKKTDIFFQLYLYAAGIAPLSIVHKPPVQNCEGVL